MGHEIQEHVVEVLRDALTITVFVFVMMVVVEYVNVLTRGAWQRKLMLNRWRQYVLSALLGIVPGDLGPFAVTAMYAHGTVSIGALITVMLAAAGDASFVMLAIVPMTALKIMATLLVLGIVVGALADALFGARLRSLAAAEKPLQIHEEQCEFFNREIGRASWRVRV